MLSESVQAAVSQVLSSRKQLPGALLPILHGIQDAVGHIPREAVDVTAGGFGVKSIVVSS